MILKFNNTSCSEASRNEKSFGICDDQNGAKAYTISVNTQNWIAEVINDSEQVVTFTAIDNCFIIHKPGTKNKESTCDGVLIFNDSIYLIELKIQAVGGWLPKAIEQLENTIKLIDPNLLKNYKYKKAYACNKKHPNFTTIDNELSRRFFREYGFRIDAQRKILIK